MTKAKPDTKRSFSPKPYIAAGYASVFLGLGVFGTWAATAPLASGVVAHGVVSVEGNRKTIQHLEGGIVSEIVVKEGDIVNQGDVLVKIDRPRQPAIIRSGAPSFFTSRRQKRASLQKPKAVLISTSRKPAEQHYSGSKSSHGFAEEYSGNTPQDP